MLGQSQSGGRSSLRLLRVLEHADDITIARTLADRVVQADPELLDPAIADYVALIEQVATGDWERAT